MADQYPDVAKRLMKAVGDWKEEMGRESRGRRPFTVGCPGSKMTYLPARDGVSHGCVKRSNRYPNDSHFINWTDTKGSVTWDIDVLTAGDYQVELYYTCAEEDVGIEIELSFGDKSIRTEITEAHDPPCIGAPNDRSKRGESEVKYFKPVRLGIIALSEKRGLLTLKALRIPGRKAMDVRTITLTRM